MVADDKVVTEERRPYPLKALIADPIKNAEPEKIAGKTDFKWQKNTA
jgi:hypothetical protein